MLSRRIDGTVLSLNNDSYFVWSCLRPLTGYANPVQSICISKLTSPTAIDSGNIGVISQPDQPWEQIGTADVPAVNEGPNPLYWAGET
jgi:GH43 family beta-xylosidase